MADLRERQCHECGCFYFELISTGTVVTEPDNDGVCPDCLKGKVDLPEPDVSMHDRDSEGS